MMINWPCGAIGRASDSRSEGQVFKSPQGHRFILMYFPNYRKKTFDQIFLIFSYRKTNTNLRLPNLFVTSNVFENCTKHRVFID